MSMDKRISAAESKTGAADLPPALTAAVAEVRAEFDRDISPLVCESCRGNVHSYLADCGAAYVGWSPWRAMHPMRTHIASILMQHPDCCGKFLKNGPAAPPTPHSTDFEKPLIGILRTWLSLELRPDFGRVGADAEGAD
jgi:hypothetical protein